MTANTGSLADQTSQVNQIAPNWMHVPVQSQSVAALENGHRSE